MLAEASGRRWISPAEFAALYGLSRPHVYNLLARRLLPGCKRKGVGWLIDKVKFEAELQAGVEAGGRVQ